MSDKSNSRLTNLVSKMWLGLEETIEWYDKVSFYV